MIIAPIGRGASSLINHLSNIDRKVVTKKNSTLKVTKEVLTRSAVGEPKQVVKLF
jgi:hypothetical protein